MTGVEDEGARTRVLSVRLTQDEWDYVEQEAADAGMRPSEWVRGCILPEVS